MSKIGRKPISLGAVEAEVKGSEVHYKDKKSSGVHRLPDFIKARVDGKELFLDVAESLRADSDVRRVWGLHRALLANVINGLNKMFEKKLKIIGLGFKAALAGSKITLTVGYTHKIDFNLPRGVSLEIDKTGQILTLKSADKWLLGDVCDKLRAFRMPELYKGTGIRYFDEVIVQKPGKAKATAAA